MNPQSQPPPTWLGVGLPALRFLRNLPNFVRLYWRLLRDRRVSLWPKAVLLLSMAYVVSPLDFLPDVIPFAGQVDDLLIVILVCRQFIHWCPRDVVAEHVHRIATRG